MMGIINSNHKFKNELIKWLDDDGDDLIDVGVLVAEGEGIKLWHANAEHRGESEPSESDSEKTRAAAGCPHLLRE